MEDTLFTIGDYIFGSLICLAYEGLLTLIAYAIMECCSEWGSELARRSKTRKDRYEWCDNLTTIITLIFFVIYAAPIVYLHIATKDDDGMSWLICGIIAFVLMRCFYFCLRRITGRESLL